MSLGAFAWFPKKKVLQQQKKALNTTDTGVQEGNLSLGAQFLGPSVPG